MRRLCLKNIKNLIAVLTRLFFGGVSKKAFGTYFSQFYLSLFILIFIGSFSASAQQPDYTYNSAESKNLDRFSITATDALNVQAKLNRLIIAVDTNPGGEQFVLTFGNGIKKVGVGGGLIDFIGNPSDRLSNAMDFAINSEGKFFVATNESNRRFIRVFAPDGTYLASETLGDGTYGTGANKFKGPVGLTFDQADNLYVADQYLGTADP
ncbi:MAG: hypothetical protein WBL27_06705, partial [Salinimicrobium sp.]